MANVFKKNEKKSLFFEKNLTNYETFHIFVLYIIKLNTEITQKQMKQYCTIAINPDFNESPLVNRAFCDENLIV